MSAPRISIVTPSFNQGAFVRQTIESVLGQRYPGLEYVVVDGASTDGSANIIREYASRLHHFVSEPDRGHADALNKGFRHSSGEIMAWLNSDDLYLPWTLQVVADVFTEHPDVEWITGIQGFWSDRGVLLRTENRFMNLHDYLKGDFMWIQQESVFWRRSLWDRTGAAVNGNYRLMVDGELWTRFFAEAELWHVQAVLSGYRDHGGNRALAAPDDCVAEMRRAIEALKARPDFGRMVASRSDTYPILHYDRAAAGWLKARGSREAIKGG